jgi:hypothetical protein
MILEGCDSLSLLLPSFYISKLGLVCHKYFFILIIKWEREYDDIYELVVNLLNLNEKKILF